MFCLCSKDKIIGCTVPYPEWDSIDTEFDDTTSECGSAHQDSVKNREF